MTTQEQLEEIRNFPYRAEKIVNRIRKANASVMPRSPELSDMPKAKRDGDIMAEATSIMADEKKRLDEYFARIRAIEPTAWADVMKIPKPSQRHVIILYYFERVETWEDVAEVTGYSESQVYRLRDSAIEFLERCE